MSESSRLGRIMRLLYVRTVSGFFVVSRYYAMICDATSVPSGGSR